MLMCTMYFLMLLFEEDAIPFFSGATTTSGAAGTHDHDSNISKLPKSGLCLHILHHISLKVRV